MGSKGFNNLSGSQTPGSKLEGNPSLNYSASSSQAFFFFFLVSFCTSNKLPNKEVAHRTLTTVVTERERDTEIIASVSEQKALMAFLQELRE